MRRIHRYRPAEAHKLRGESLAHLATIASSLAAIVALAASIYQFRVNLRVQENVLQLQMKTFEMERAVKAGDLFCKFLEIRFDTKDFPSKREQRDDFYFQRNNRALLVLNSLYSSTKGDQKWEKIIFWSLIRYRAFARDRKIKCMSLTEDFIKYIEESIPDDTKNMCFDITDSD